MGIMTALHPSDMLAGRIANVTGGSRGIGREMAEA
jgi:NAD(P)-dependent dehydrogenase (short-subunit alcohol dehydrogenase family)